VPRIIGGSAGGRHLQVPPGRDTRPTSDRVREALFSALESAFGGLDGLSVLDLYAGSGALGLESLSRGAARATLVERDPNALKAIRANVAALGLPGAEVVAAPVATYLSGPPTGFDLVLADPPYADPVDELVTALADGWVAGTVVLEQATRSRAPAWPAPLEHHRSKRYGDTTLWYARRV
jgi:16S rRNA (guanine966-N2)-methyltransferase